MKNKSNKVSVIISVYNGENYLAEAIDSVLQQDYPEKEIIVVDDGSTDHTKKIIEKFKKYIVSVYQKNQGLGAGRNAGVAIATGDYYAFLDHDDLFAKDKLHQQMQLMKNHLLEDPLIFSYAKQFICPTLDENEAKKIFLKQTVLPGYIAGTLLLSKKRFHQVGFFIEKKQLGEFIDWYLRALEIKVPVIIKDHIGLYRRVHRHNMGRQLDDYHRADYLKILKNSLDRRRSLNDCYST